MNDKRSMFGIATAAKYLIGNRAAIEAVGKTKSLFWLGLLFVLSAGFAREYDGADLWYEPWHFALPLVVSLASATLLWTFLLVLVFYTKDPERAMFVPWIDIVSYYWLMSPMSWLYAIPFERYSTPATAMAFNLWVLTLVAIWRVLLLARVMAVRLRCSYVAAFFPVMLFADVIAAIAVHVTPQPIWNLMGGVRLSPADQVLLDAVCIAKAFTFLSFPIWFIGSAISIIRYRPRTAVEIEELPRRVSPQLWGVAISCVLIWVCILPWTQPEQRHRHEVSALFANGKYSEMMAYLSSHRRSEFPPHWELPPRLGWDDNSLLRPQFNQFYDLIAASLRPGITDWVRQSYVDLFIRHGLSEPQGYSLYVERFNVMTFLQKSGDNDPQLPALLQIASSSDVPIRPNSEWSAAIREFLADSNVVGQKRQILETLQTRFETDPAGGTWTPTGDSK
jgi:hypothetical protein